MFIIATKKQFVLRLTHTDLFVNVIVPSGLRLFSLPAVWQHARLINRLMSYTVTEESFDSLNRYWSGSTLKVDWPSVFVLPSWLQTWWRSFGEGAAMCLRSIQGQDDILGIAPLITRGETAQFMGDTDVCDYQDFIIAPGRERDFFTVLLDHLGENGTRQLDLQHVRPESTVLTHLAGIAKDRAYEVVIDRDDISLEVDLPATWDDYLSLLNKKQRHEVRRKLRRLEEAGSIEHRCIDAGDEIGEYMETFLSLFPVSREDKAEFMTPQMESFFRDMTKAMAEIGLLRFGIIELDGKIVAMTIGFDYNNAHYLYNNAYNPEFDYYSVGLLCKVLCIRESIEKGKQRWDFLKGAETYKYHLGGREVPLYRCRITLT